MRVRVQTSPLEALILKRRLMGPSWILIKSPQAVSAQRSWCKTEVQVSGHKAVCIPPTQRDAPPLTVRPSPAARATSHHQSTSAVVGFKAGSLAMASRPLGGGGVQVHTHVAATGF